jgi:hypothetical protein
MNQAKVYVIHENEAWIEPLRAAFEARRLPFEEWFLDQGTLNLAEAPPEGVFYNRMSASSHTRDHRFAPEYTGCVLAWLQSHGRRLVNSGRALQLEVSKVAQYTALEAHGIRTPRTVAAVGRQEIIEAALGFDGPFISKHNRAGKGLGVHLFFNHEDFAEYVAGRDFEPSVDGVTLVQEYIQAPEPFITRVEFVGGRLVYAVRVDTSEGFELCPADACGTGKNSRLADGKPANLFTVLPDFHHPLVERYASFLAANDIEVAGVEFIVDAKGEAYTYDINTNTNYNPQAEAEAGLPGRGMGATADFLCAELARETGDAFGCIQAAE